MYFFRLASWFPFTAFNWNSSIKKSDTYSLTQEEHKHYFLQLNNQQLRKKLAENKSFEIWTSLRKKQEMLFKGTEKNLSHSNRKIYQTSLIILFFVFSMLISISIAIVPLPTSWNVIIMIMFIVPPPYSFLTFYKYGIDLEWNNLWFKFLLHLFLTTEHQLKLQIYMQSHESTAITTADVRPESVEKICRRCFCKHKTFEIGWISPAHQQFTPTN